MRMDEEALFSITDCKSAQKISAKLLALRGIDASSVVTDLTACVGGNVISFGAHFSRVNAVEIDATRHDMLVTNVRDVVGLKNVRFFNCDAVQLFASSSDSSSSSSSGHYGGGGGDGGGASGAAAVPVSVETVSGAEERLQQDILFLDPPWGGLDYRASDQLHLHLGGVDMGELVETRLRGRAKYVALKLPQNFAVDDFKRDVSGAVTAYRDLRKMLLLIVDYSS